MIVQVRQFPDPRTRYAHDAFAAQIGELLPVSVAGQRTGQQARLIAAEVDDGGTAVTLTLELPDNGPPGYLISRSRAPRTRP